MGLLVDGEWQDKWYDTDSKGGKFERESAAFRNWVTADGEAGPTGEAGFAAAAGRYHLFVSPACPWSHRAMLLRTLKGLEDIVGLTQVDPEMLENGWEFSEISRDNPLPELKFLHQLYTRVKPEYTGRVTVPVLWDRERETIVSNESADIVRMFNSAFAEAGANNEDYYPARLTQEIDELNAWIYQRVNNGVYRAGFATSQGAYREAFESLFEALDSLESKLENQAYLTGDRPTEADWRLFPTLIRFDAVYHGHFKCNRQRLEDFHHLANYTRDLYQYHGVAATVDMDQIKTHYYVSQRSINPSQVVPLGPLLNFERSHDRDRLKQQHK